MKTTFTPLYKKTANGNLQFWQISVDGNVITTSHGRVDGKQQVSSEVIDSGKNIGKANETTPAQQAELEAHSRWTKQQDRKGYVDDRAKVDVDQRPGAEPMLAHRYDKYPDKIKFPCAVQPKLDGHRCIAVYESGTTSLFSRQRKAITGLPHIEKAITDLMLKIGRTDRVVLDGELYNHDYRDNFEALTSHIRNESPKDGYQIVQYHLYDLVSEDVPFKNRTSALATLLDGQNDVLKLVETKIVDTEDGVAQIFREYRNDSYEGAILRNLDGLYVGKRSYDLQKVKEFDDDEFTIVGVEEGRGKMKGHAIFECKTVEGKLFRAKMMGSLTDLAEYFQKKELYIGRIITVRFQGLTSDGIPRFPVAVRFREDV